MAAEGSRQVWTLRQGIQAGVQISAYYRVQRTYFLFRSVMEYVSDVTMTVGQAYDQ